MAAHTGESGAGEAAVLVARAAVEHPVGEIEREAGPRGVVPVDGLPAGRPVAHLALVAQPRLVRIVASANPVAVVALRRRALRDACQVTAGARRREVAALEREQRRLVERARGGPPRDRRVTLFALVAEGAAMGVLGAVTRRAGAAQPGESHRRAVPGRERPGLRLVAGAAGGRTVCADEERRFQLLVRVLRHRERLGRVARLALLAKLPEMDVLVARRAVRSLRLERQDASRVVARGRQAHASRRLGGRARRAARGTGCSGGPRAGRSAGTRRFRGRTCSRRTRPHRP